MEIRLKKAKEQLRSTDASIAEIAALVGNAVKHSSSRIRKNSGVSLRSLKSCDSSYGR